MNDKQKNVITNLIGLSLLLLNIYMFYWEALELTSFLVVLCISLVSFLFKGSKTREWLGKALSKIISR